MIRRCGGLLVCVMLSAWAMVGCGADAIEAELRDTAGDAALTDAQEDTSGVTTVDTGADMGADTGAPSPRCGDGAVGGQEACDGQDFGGATCASLGFDGGALGCLSDCKFDLSACTSSVPRCGDGVLQAPEVCDGAELGGLSCGALSLGSGTLTCAPTCTIDATGCGGPAPTCGDGLAQGAEACDGADLKGKTCLTEGFVSGALLCDSDCTQALTVQCSRCGDGVIDAGEACDGVALNNKTCATEGFDSGALACSSACALDTSGCARSTCGNGALDQGEACEGSDLNNKTCLTQGFDGGTLTCAANCALNTAACTDCGDSVAQGAEACDGADLRSKSCVTEGFDGGALTCTPTCALSTAACTRVPAPAGGQVVITEVMHSPSGATSRDWFEVHNVTATTFNLQGCTVSTDTTPLTYVIPSRLLITPGSSLTFAASGHTAFTPSHVVPGLSLATDDVITLRCGSPAVDVDEVLYVSGTGYFPSLPGSSLSLKPSQTTAAANDAEANWCLSVADYAAPDRGSPGVINPACPTGVVEFCRLQYPDSIGPGSTLPGLPATVYGRLYIPGLTTLTSGNDPSPLLIAQVGYGPFGDDPRTLDTWTWLLADSNSEWAGAEVNNDEYQADLPASIPAGDYSFTFRFSYDGGTTWLTCDLNGARADGGLPFSVNDLGTLEIP